MRRNVRLSLRDWPMVSIGGGKGLLQSAWGKKVAGLVPGDHCVSELVWTKPAPCGESLAWEPRGSFRLETPRGGATSGMAG